MASAQYNLASIGGHQENKRVTTETYRSPFSPSGHAQFVWSDLPSSLPQILKDNSLPLVVKLSEESAVRKTKDSSVDFRQPLLLFREHQEARLYARCVRAEGEAWTEIGPYLVIPANYQGLFRPVGQETKPLKLVSNLARLMPVSFLSTVACDGFECVNPIESDTVYRKCPLTPGVYVVQDVLEDDICVHSDGPKNYKTKLVRCLRCVNDRSATVLFPLKAQGEFFIAGVEADCSRHASVEKSARVFRWPELCSHGGQDRYSRCILVHGKPPSQECNFTGILNFKHVTSEHTVIGSTTGDEHPRLLELSVSKGPHFVVALNQDDLRADLAISRCLKFVKQECERYVSEIKIRRDYEIDSAKARENKT